MADQGDGAKGAAGGKKKKKGQDQDLLELAGNREEFNKEKKKLLKAELEMQLEVLDGTPERMKEFKRQEAEGYCKCKECGVRRMAIAVRRVDWGLERINEMFLLDEMVQNAYRGGAERLAQVEAMIKLYGWNALVYQGGPILVYGCMICKSDTKNACLHCGREQWMKVQKEVYVMRKDYKTMPRFLETTLLHAAAMNGQVKLVDKLLKMGAPVNGQDGFGCTPMHWVTCQGHRGHQTRGMQLIKIAEMLLEADATVTIQDKEKKTPAELTFPPNPPWNTMRTTILKHRRASLNKMLLAFCQDGNAEAASRMVHAGADLGCGDWLGDTPFHVSVTFGHVDLFLDLTELAKVEGRLLQLLNAKSVEGHTLVDMAVKWGYWSLAERIKGIIQEQEVRVAVSKAVAGGGELDPKFRGTLVGKQMARELKKQQGVKARLVKNLRLEQKAISREMKRSSYFKAGDPNGGPQGSSTCAIM
ncbi:ankyrin repeat-containing domain protein [Baffinella frigidus]|nr:ankyrin repeat-containing domain protein [Cryptophyta sp. CCMP2293]